jgi:cytoskeletal protein RodZ
MINGFKTKVINHKSFGESLSRIRLAKELTLEQAQEATQIRLRYLEAFEKNSFSCLPDEVYSIGYLKKYLEFLGITNDKLVNEFKKEYRAWQSINKLSLKPETPQEKRRLIITPRLLVIAGGVLSVLIVISYIGFQVRHLTNPPQLSIKNPHSAKVALDSIEVTGETDPGATVAINNQVISQDQEGNFKQAVALEAGVNTIHVVATNRFQKQNAQTLTIVRIQKGDTNGTEKNS